jgi:hypothetical protein
MASGGPRAAGHGRRATGGGPRAADNSGGLIGVTIMRITSKHPVRAAVADIATYHSCKGAAVFEVCLALSEFDIEPTFPDLNGPEGYVTCALRPAYPGRVVCDCCADKLDKAEYDNVLVFAWYTLSSGRVELTAYIS